MNQGLSPAALTGERGRGAALAAVGGATMLVVWFLRLDPLGWWWGEVATPSSDGDRYIEMVDALRPCGEQPFCWRVVVPTTVRVLPVEHARERGR